jgi:hypothetical protein
MKTFELIPTIKCGEVSFHTDRTSVRTSLGRYKTFRKSRTSENTTDDFGYCHTYYNQSEQLIAIEFFPETDLRYEGYELFKLTSAELASLICSNDAETIDDSYYLTSKKLGIGAEFDENKVNSILVCTSDYYD